MKKYIPTATSSSVINIDYQRLFLEGKKVLIFDIDNTLLSYKEIIPSKDIIELGKSLKEMGFIVVVSTNNHLTRIKSFLEVFSHDYCLYHLGKPFKNKLNKFIQENHYSKEEILMIGDQMVTDISCANKLHVDSILVKSLDRTSEHLYTRINRLREPIILKLTNINKEYKKEIKGIIKK